MLFPCAIPWFFSVHDTEFFLGLFFSVPFVSNQSRSVPFCSPTLKQLSLLIITLKSLIAREHLLLNFTAESTGYNIIPYIFFFLFLTCVPATKTCRCFSISDDSNKSLYTPLESVSLFQRPFEVSFHRTWKRLCWWLQLWNRIETE